MPAYSFKERFCPWVIEGSKTQTVRAIRKGRQGHAKPGDTIYLGTRSVTSYMYWRKVLSWDREAKEAGKRRRVFCASLADVFEDWDGHVIDSKGEPLYWNDRFCNSDVVFKGKVDRNGGGFQFTDCDDVPTFSHYPLKRLTDETSSQEFMEYNKWEPLSLDVIRQHLFRLIERTNNLDWLLLTKRPENIMSKVPGHWRLLFPANVWIGTSIEDQAAADVRIPFLLQVPAWRFLSCEPLLGSVDLKLSTRAHMHPGPVKFGCPFRRECIHWVIAGGESGAHARPMHPDWARSLRDQCHAAEIPFLFKQWGEWRQYDHWDGDNAKPLGMFENGVFRPGNIVWDFKKESVHMAKVGKKTAGRLLDGREWNEFPNILNT